MPLFAEGKFALVKQQLKEALRKEARGWIGLHDLYAVLVNIATLQRDGAALREYAPKLEKEAAHLDHSLYIAVAHRGWGVLHTLAGQYTEARPRLDQALTLFGSLDTHWQLGRTHFELGELALAQADTTLARDHYSQALAAFEEMKAAPDAERARSKLASLG